MKTYLTESRAKMLEFIFEKGFICSLCYAELMTEEKVEYKSVDFHNLVRTLILQKLIFPIPVPCNAHKNTKYIYTLTPEGEEKFAPFILYLIRKTKKLPAYWRFFPEEIKKEKEEEEEKATENELEVNEQRLSPDDF